MKAVTGVDVMEKTAIEVAMAIASSFYENQREKGANEAINNEFVLDVLKRLEFSELAIKKAMEEFIRI